jgi:menaquinol-cytochrome c reductase iron-sulfur subunit
MRKKDSSDSATNKSRRAFVLLVPLAAIGGVFASVATAAIRFLRPITIASNQKWIDVARVAEISGSKPVARKVIAEEVAGWAKSLAEHSVYVLPGKNNQVLSAVCPHEGCEVSWRDDENVFSCPCHDSDFAPDGRRISGPAPRGLDVLPSRIEGDRLQVQYRSFINNTQERTPRG